jgi:Spy/CpxP family protein refolding chaperone
MGEDMKENIKIILVIASFALNLVFISTYVIYKLSARSNINPSSSAGPVYHQLHLAPEQVARFEQERPKFRARIQELGQAIKTKQTELLNLIMAKPSNLSAIKEKQEEIRRLQGMVQAGVIDHLVKVSSFLNPEQRSRFFKILKARIKTSVQASPPWMRSSGQEWLGKNKNE